MKIIAHAEDHSSGIYSLCLGAEGTFYSGSGDRFVVRWNAKTLEQTGFAVKLEEPVFAVYFCDSTNILYIGTSSGGIHLVDVLSKKEIKHFKIHSSSIYSFLHLESKNEMIAISGDGTISIWNTASHALIRRIPISQEKIRSIAKSQDESTIALGDNDGLIHVLETDFFNELHTINGDETGVTSLTFHPNKPILLAGGKDAHLKTFLIPNAYSVLTNFPAHKAAIYGIRFSPNGKFFTTVSRDKTFKLWNTTTLEVEAKIEIKSSGHTHSVNAVLWLDDEHFITAGDDRRINLVHITG